MWTVPDATGQSEGPWQRANGWQTITELTRGDEVFVFDPPDIVFVNGGERVRVVGYDTATPVLEVDRISGGISRHPMSAAAREPSAGA